MAAPLFAATDFIEGRIKLEWRRWLCREFMNSYYSNRAFFRLHQQTDVEIDNPDQVQLWLHFVQQDSCDCREGSCIFYLLHMNAALNKGQLHINAAMHVACCLSTCSHLQRICDDVEAFAGGSVTLLIGLVRKLFNIVAFSGIAPDPAMTTCAGDLLVL